MSTRKPDIWFVAETALQYAQAQLNYAKNSGRGAANRTGRKLWEKYAYEVVKNWRACKPTPELKIISPMLQPYETVEALRQDVRHHNRLWVWGGLPFSEDHPMRQPEGRSALYPAAYYARAFHDLLEHVDGGLGFDFISELKAAERQRRHYPDDLQPVVWTDDVAIGCYREYFGQWPDVQCPVVLKPDWPRLARYIRQREARIHQYCVEEGAYGN